MQIQQLNRTDAEKIFIIVENKEGGALANEDVVEWDSTNNAGISVEKADSANAPNVAGVAIEAIADGAYGRIQIYGVHTAVATNTTVTIATADASETTGDCVDASASTDQAANLALAQFGHVVRVTDTNSSQIFLRCM